MQSYLFPFDERYIKITLWSAVRIAKDLNISGVSGVMYLNNTKISNSKLAQTFFYFFLMEKCWMLSQNQLFHQMFITVNANYLISVVILIKITVCIYNRLSNLCKVLCICSIGTLFHSAQFFPWWKNTALESRSKRRFILTNV